MNQGLLLSKWLFLEFLNLLKRYATIVFFERYNRKMCPSSMAAHLFMHTLNSLPSILWSKGYCEMKSLSSFPKRERMFTEKISVLA